MGLAITSVPASSDADASDPQEPDRTTVAREVDVDDVRQLLQELRLRRRLRAQG